MNRHHACGRHRHLGVLTILVYVPAAVTSGVGAVVNNDFVQPIARGELLGQWRRLAVSLMGILAQDGWIALVYPPLVVIALIEGHRSFGQLVNPTVGVVGVGAAMAVQAVSPPTRVLLFGWPLTFGLAGIGSQILVARGTRLKRRGWLVPTLAVGLAAAMSIAVVASDEVLRSREAGTFRDGPSVADLMVDVVGEGDRIVVESHPRPVLEYYLRRRGWSGPQLQRDYEDADRLLVIVYYPRPQDLDGVLEAVPTQDFTEPRLLKHFNETDVFVMYRVG